jgi:hypothetical protein
MKYGVRITAVSTLAGARVTIREARSKAITKTRKDENTKIPFSNFRPLTSDL